MFFVIENFDGFNNNNVKCVEDNLLFFNVLHIGLLKDNNWKFYIIFCNWF